MREYKLFFVSSLQNFISFLCPQFLSVSVFGLFNNMIIGHISLSYSSLLRQTDWIPVKTVDPKVRTIMTLGRFPTEKTCWNMKAFFFFIADVQKIWKWNYWIVVLFYVQMHNNALNKEKHMPKYKGIFNLILSSICYAQHTNKFTCKALWRIDTVIVYVHSYQ